MSRGIAIAWALWVRWRARRGVVRLGDGASVYVTRRQVVALIAHICAEHAPAGDGEG